MHLKFFIKQNFGRANLMKSNDLRGVADGERLLALVELCLQLINTQVQTEGLFFEGKTEEGKPTTLTVAENQKKANLLRGAVRVVQVDGDLTLTSAERVHRELGGTPHPVPRAFNTCSRKISHDHIN